MKERKFVFGICAVLFAAILATAPLGIRAARQISLSGGANIIYDGEEIVTRPDDEELAEQKEKLEDAGFVLSDDGTRMLSNVGSIGANKSQLQKMRDSLIGGGILSYCRYRGSVCTVQNELVVMLDFSDYYILGFEESCLDGLKDIIFGNWDIAFTAEVPTLDSVTGASLGAVNATFSQGGYVIDGVRSERYSLRVILPDIGEEEFSFGENSLNFSMTGTPAGLAIDISNLALTLTDGRIRGIVMDEYAFGVNWLPGGRPGHLHFIGRNEEQLSYILSETLKLAEGIDLGVLGADFVTEIFVKENPENIFSRLTAGVEKTRSGEMTVTVFDQPEDASSPVRDAIAVLDLGHWFRYLYDGDIPAGTAFEHVRRGADGQVDQNDIGTLTYDWTGEADGQGVFRHTVTCTHDASGTTGSVIGYFTPDRRFFGPDGSELSM